MIRSTLLATLALALAPLTAPPPAAAGEADVVGVKVTRLGGDGATVEYRFDVTVAHADTGWEHYADAWDVLAPDGTVLGTRTLFHPHVDEQPFTRSLTLRLPADLERVAIRAHDKVDGYGGETKEVALPR